MYELISFVKRAPNRKKVLAHLEQPKTPSELSKEIGLSRPAISRTLLELQKKGLVDCLTPNERMGRLYQITPEGRNILGKA